MNSLNSVLIEGKYHSQDKADSSAFFIIHKRSRKVGDTTVTTKIKLKIRVRKQLLMDVAAKFLKNDKLRIVGALEYDNKTTCILAEHLEHIGAKYAN